MSNPNQRLTSPLPLEQLRETDASVLIKVWGEEFEAAEPLAYANIYATDVCDDLSTAVLHPRHYVVDAALDLFQRFATTSRSPNVHSGVLAGMKWAIERPDGHGLGQALDIVDVLRDGYSGDGSPIQRAGEPEVALGIKSVASNLRYRAFFRGVEYRVAAQRQIREAGEELGNEEDQNNRLFKLVETVADEDDSSRLSTLFLATLGMALGRAERRQIFASLVPLDALDEKDLEALWVTHHAYYPTDLLGGIPKGRELIINNESPEEAVIGYLTDMDQSVPAIVSAVRKYQERTHEAETVARDTFIGALG